MTEFLMMAVSIMAVLLAILILSFDGEIDMKWIGYSLVSTVGVVAAAGVVVTMMNIIVCG